MAEAWRSGIRSWAYHRSYFTLGPVLGWYTGWVTVFGRANHLRI